MDRMVITDSSTPELLRLETLRDALRSPGPCITILLPPYHPGEPAGSPAAVLKSQIQGSAGQLAERKFSKSESADLLQPLECLAEEPGLVSGSHWGRAILRSPTVFEQFQLTQPVEASLTVGGSFAIRKLAQELARPAVFYILAVSKTKVSLLHCAGLHAELAKLLPGFPNTLAEALALERPDHDLENRSAAGSSLGTMRKVRFGTGSERESQHTHMAEFYRLVDRAINELSPGPDVPLVLSGVEEETAAYRAVSTYPGLVKESISGSLDVLRERTEMLRQAYALLRNDNHERQAASLIKARESTAPERFSTDPDIVLRAAFEGRVGRLYVNESAVRIDVFERGPYRSLGPEDLLNLAAVQTLTHGGETCDLPAEMMPEGAVVAGLMRY